ncbi:MAG TPA: translational GTPase TypA [Candidatus Saccharimonadales bacterium]|nr:translational GTPase TypA [Candidatus Saccharimonadales bacterium]
MQQIAPDKIRNVAVIAHVDHGKTTLVDFMLKQSHTFRENEAEMTQTTILDSNPLERERGITILAKNTAIYFNDFKINIIDTPGHADFSGEVERTLNMADGALLIIDAQEGPMPQTKFVLKKALELGLKIIVVINKIDKQLAQVEQTIEQTNDLFLELATDPVQLEFPVLFAIGREGKAAKTLEGVKNATSVDVIMQEIIDFIPPPSVEQGPFQMIVTSLDFDSHKGRHVIGRIKRGIAKQGESVVIVKENGRTQPGKIDTIALTHGLKKIPVETAPAGEIVDITGVSAADISDTITDPSDPTPLPRISLEQPTLSITFGANTSPFAGKEGKFTNSRQLLERLQKELETNIGLKLSVTDEGFVVSGRGELHLSVLIETLRREGYEFQVGKPQVITKQVDGEVLEPVEELFIDVPDDYVGTVTEELGKRKGQMLNMHADGKGNTRLTYKIPSKNLLGMRSDLLTSTRGTAVINSMLSGFEKMSPAISQIRNGVLIASEGGSALHYGLNNAQERGITFIDPGTKVYEGMIVGLHARGEDIEINVTKEKKQTNMRASTSDVSLGALTPATKMSLEQSIDFLEDDELLEVTPLNLRLRKKYLSKLNRVRNSRNK